MTFPEEDFPAVRDAAMAVMREGKAAGIWVFSSGLHTQVPNVVRPDGSIKSEHLKPGSPQIGGFTIIEVSTKEDAIYWAQKIAVACRCAQEVKELMPDPDRNRDVN